MEGKLSVTENSMDCFVDRFICGTEGFSLALNGIPGGPQLFGGYLQTYFLFSACLLVVFIAKKQDYGTNEKRRFICFVVLDLVEPPYVVGECIVISSVLDIFFY